MEQRHFELTAQQNYIPQHAQEKGSRHLVAFLALLLEAAAEVIILEVFRGLPWWLFFLLLPMLLMPRTYKQAKARTEVMTLLLFMCLSNKRTKKPFFVETMFWFSFRTLVSSDALCRDAAFAKPRSSEWLEIQFPEFLPAEPGYGTLAGISGSCSPSDSGAV